MEKDGDGMGWDDCPKRDWLLLHALSRSRVSLFQGHVAGTRTLNTPPSTRYPHHPVPHRPHYVTEDSDLLTGCPHYITGCSH